jgi:2-polyprenyl-3-methyl-5-hydroxy-6-metoxy-1,4-benzoquinol methylase
MKANYIPAVRDQYEDYPYPYRDPKDEKKRLSGTATDHLPMINHYVYGGRQTFRNGYEVLVAGGGTGDAAIYMAEQLRGMPGARVTYVDLSAASMAVARERAKVRKLYNIDWHQMSLLDVADLGKTFDFINCSGVLHHLASPEDGLAALRGVLKPDGAMGIMVYAQYGRAAVYQMQELLRKTMTPDMSAADKVALTKKILALLPQTNLFRAQEKWRTEVAMDGDIGLYDLLLHSTDRAYTVPQLYAWIEGAGLNILRFCGKMGQRLHYMPEFVLGRDPALLAHIKTLPLPRQHAIAEAAHSTHIKHSVLVTQGGHAIASPEDEEMVPFFFMDCLDGAKLSQRLNASSGQGIEVDLPDGVRLSLQARPYAADILRHLDGQRTVGEILAAVAQENNGKTADVKAEFLRLYTQIEMTDALLLRHKTVPAFEPLTPLAKRIARNRK